MRRLIQRPISDAYSELWARCDECRWSGPWLKFTWLLDRAAANSLHLCDGCSGNEQLLVELERHGWWVA